ncbi:MAG: beta-glucosidase, partial [Flavobacteriia bacterium]
SLDLPGNQREFLIELQKTGKPIILVLINGRPISINWADAHIPAIVEVWFPGLHGGTAIAEVLFGNYNPGGKMPVTTPRTVGQIPFNFPFKPNSQAGQGKPGPNGFGKTRVVDELYPFGYGLSYTNFKYSDLKISPEKGNQKTRFKISFTIKNTGDLEGEEVVQLYVNDEYSSVTQYEKLLRGFERIHLKKGEKKQVSFVLESKDLELLNKQMKWVTEPGKFNIYIGSSSKDIRLKGSFIIE